MAKSIQLRFAVCLCWFFATVATSMAVYASEATRFSKGLTSIPIQDIYLLLLIIFFGGLLATLMKVTKENAPRISNLTLEISKDAAGSLMAGGIGYLTMSWVDQEVYKVPVLLQPIIVFFCAFRGIKLIVLLEPLYNEGLDGVIGLFRDFMSRIFGRKNATPPPPPTDPKP